jgi:molecular chaperone DnaJ
MEKDLYSILGVSKGASHDEIKKAYKKLALKHHPDKNGGSKESEDMFKEISDAYSILSDPEKRENYDRFGTKKNPFGGGGGFDPSDLFSQFDSFFNFGNKRGPQKPRGSDIRIKIRITLQDILNGLSKKIKYTRKEKCGGCSGTGGKSTSVCNPCGGTGKRTVVQSTPLGQMRTLTHCELCDGSGIQIKDPCFTCSGNGTVSKETTSNIEIPKGTTGGSYMTMEGGGNWTRGGTPGDLQIVIEEVPDSLFKREDINLIYQSKITIPDAILGKKFTLTHPSGEEIHYHVQGGTQHGKFIKISGGGIPDFYYPGRSGDLYIQIEINIPQSITEEERDILEKMKSMPNFN